MSEEYKHGIPISLWNKARAELRKVLIKYASDRQTVPYSTVVRLIKTIRLHQHDEWLVNMLWEISTREYTEGRGMLSVVVVRKSGSQLPGGGFFELAASLGKDISNRHRCWGAEFERVCDYWSDQERRPSTLAKRAKTVRRKVTR